MDSLERATGQLTQEIEEVQGAAGRQLRQSAHWRQQAELLASIPGAGERTAALLLSEMPPVERCASAKNWAAFCGPAPEPRQPGKGSYSRLAGMGSARVRAGLCVIGIYPASGKAKRPGAGGPLPAGHQRPALESGGAGFGAEAEREGEARGEANRGGDAQAAANLLRSPERRPAL